MDRLYEVVKKIDIELNDHQLEQFQRYYELLVEWNKVMNLTAITEKEDVIIVFCLQNIKSWMNLYQS